jgi:ABC-type nitrate/sulfonate/bicarbonate transport system permease component
MTGTAPVPVPAAAEEQRARENFARQRRSLAWQRLLLGVGVPLGLALVWELLARTGAVDARFFPPPSRIFAALLAVIASAQERAAVLSDVAITLVRLVTGYVLGSVAGVAIGMMMALNRTFRFGIGPMIYGTFPLPKVALFPLLIVIFGLGEGSKTALVTLGAFYMACINTAAGVLYANPIFADVARAFRVPARTRWFCIVIPAALPAIITGLKLGLGQSLILIVSAEFVAADEGLGHYIWNSWQVLDVSRLFVGLIIVGEIGGIAAMLGDLAERRLIPWAGR